MSSSRVGSRLSVIAVLVLLLSPVVAVATDGTDATPGAAALAEAWGAIVSAPGQAPQRYAEARAVSGDSFAGSHLERLGAMPPSSAVIATHELLTEARAAKSGAATSRATVARVVLGGGALDVDALEVVLSRAPGGAPTLATATFGRLRVAGADLAAPSVPHGVPVPFPGGELVLFEERVTADAVEVTGLRVTLDDGTEARFAVARLPREPGAPVPDLVRGRAGGDAGIFRQVQATYSTSAVEQDGRSSASFSQDHLTLPEKSEAHVFHAWTEASVDASRAEDASVAVIERLELFDGLVVLQSLRATSTARADPRTADGTAAFSVGTVIVQGRVVNLNGNNLIQVPVPDPVSGGRAIALIRLGVTEVVRELLPDEAVNRASSRVDLVEISIQGRDHVTLIGRVASRAEFVRDVDIAVDAAPAIVMTRVGNAADLAYVVTNPGGSTLYDVAVFARTGEAGPRAASSSAPVCVLSRVRPGETPSCPDALSPPDDVPVFVEAVGRDRLGRVASASAEAFVDVIHPELALDAVIAPGVVRAGEAVDVTLTVTNVGDVPLADVRLAHPLVAAPSPFPLGTGETRTLTLPAAASASASHVATAVALDPLGLPVDATDGTEVRVIRPALALALEAPEAVHADRPFEAVLRVTNVGDSPLDPVAVEEPLLGVFSVVGPLAPGDSAEFRATVSIDAPAALAATARGVDETARDVTAAAEAAVRVVRPELGLALDAPDVVRVGSTVEVLVTVTNLGNGPLADVVAEEPRLGTLAVGDLASGESRSFARELVVEGPVELAATSHGTDELGATVEAAASTVVETIAPALDLAVEAPPTARAGTSFDVVLVVTNTGDVELTNVLVTEPTLGEHLVPVLAPGETVRILVAVALADDAAFAADAAGTDPLGGAVAASGAAAVDVIHPALALALEAPALAYAGQDVEVVMRVANVGDVALTGVVVEESTLGAFALGDLAPGATAEVRVPHTLQGDLALAVAATGADPLGGVVSDAAAALVQAIEPALALQVTASATEVAPGTTVTLTYVVTNAGDADLADVVVDDPVLGRVLSVAALAPGESASATRDVTVQETLERLVTAGAVDPLGGALAAEAAVRVDVTEAPGGGGGNGGGGGGGGHGGGGGVPVEWEGHGAPSLEFVLVDSPSALAVGERGRVVVDVLNSGESTSRVNHLALRAALRNGAVDVPSDAASVVVRAADGAILWQGAPTPTFETERHAGFDESGATSFRTATWRLPADLSLQGGGSVRLEFDVVGAAHGRAFLEVYAPSTEDALASPADSLDAIADRTNLFTSGGRWYPTHNSFDAWDDDLSTVVKAHRWKQWSWTTHSTAGAYAKARLDPRVG